MFLDGMSRIRTIESTCSVAVHTCGKQSRIIRIFLSAYPDSRPKLPLFMGEREGWLVIEYHSCISVAEGEEGVEREAGEWFNDGENGEFH